MSDKGSKTRTCVIEQLVQQKYFGLHHPMKHILYNILNPTSSAGIPISANMSPTIYCDQTHTCAHAQRKYHYQPGWNKRCIAYLNISSCSKTGLKWSINSKTWNICATITCSWRNPNFCIYNSKSTISRNTRKFGYFASDSIK